MITSIVMASGYSRRMGENKLLMIYEKKPIIQYVLEEINKSDIDEKIVVTRFKEVESLGKKLGYKIVKNQNPEIGQSNSIKLGLENSKGNEGYMFFVGDQPLLNSHTINKLINEFKKDIEYIIVPRYNNCNGSPVIYPSRYKENLLNLQGDKGGRYIIKTSSKVKYVEVHPNNLFDIDDINDYNELKNIKIKG